MRQWGTAVTAFYILLVAALCPLAVDILGSNRPWPEQDWSITREIFRNWLALGWLALLAGGPLILLLVRVDRTPRTPERRRTIAISAIAAGQALALLVGAATWGLIAVFTGDQQDPLAALVVVGAWLIAWFGWAIVFWRAAERMFDPAQRVFRYLIAGSVLELLIAVPAHLIVRRRDECSAPFVTAFGMVTGLAILLMSLGPGILFLYRAQIRRQQARHRGVD